MKNKWRTQLFMGFYIFDRNKQLNATNDKKKIIFMVLWNRNKINKMQQKQIWFLWVIKIMQTELNEQDEHTIFIGFWFMNAKKKKKLKTNANEKIQG